MFDASYLVLGLGDVYLGAPVATPLDPRHRLVTTKYNPARTWTPENAVGIGGAYLCVYGMEGPGGYQFVGRTVQVWNTLPADARVRTRQAVAAALLRSDPFLPGGGRRAACTCARNFPQGKLALQIERETFRFGVYRRMLARNAAEIAAFKRSQSAAFLEERERWAALGQDVVSAPAAEPERRAPLLADLAPGLRAVTSPVAGNLWKVLVEPGQHVQAGAVVAIVEAMKTEIAVHASVSGAVHELCAAPGSSVMPGDRLAVIALE